MTLREVTRTVIKRVEDASGCPVVVSEDTSLKTLAAARIARGANRIHSISFNPSAVGEPDYLICFQCGFILRLFDIPAADRFDHCRSPLASLLNDVSPQILVNAEADLIRQPARRICASHGKSAQIRRTNTTRGTRSRDPFDLDVVPFFLNLGEIIFHLHAEPHFRT